MIYTKEWAENDMTGLAERVRRVVYCEEDYRLPNLGNVIPEDMLDSIQQEGMITVYRGVPDSLEAPCIRPGDWVTLTKDYALQHGHLRDGTPRILSMQVSAADVIWAGTDMNEFFYAPQSICRFDGERTHDVLNRLGAGVFNGSESVHVIHRDNGSPKVR